MVRSNSDNVEQRDPPLKDMGMYVLNAFGKGPRFKKLANNTLLATADVKIGSLSGTPLALKGATLLDMTDAAVFAECQALLQNRNLETISRCRRIYIYMEEVDGAGAHLSGSGERQHGSALGRAC